MKSVKLLTTLFASTILLGACTSSESELVSNDNHKDQHEHHHSNDGHISEHQHHHGDDGHSGEHEHHHLSIDTTVTKDDHHHHEEDS
jgi:outer membrane biogenesis lipoprotein LolB